MKPKNIIPPSKPRNLVVKNQQTSGAGAHKDKKKAQKQGQVKHKNKEFVEEWMTESELLEMAYDTMNHPKYGKIMWLNHGGAHLIARKEPNGSLRIFTMGTHAEIAKKWKSLKDKLAASRPAMGESAACRVCGQTPCNCTHISESIEQRLARKIKENVEKAEAARDPKTIQKEMSEVEKRIGVVRDAHAKAKNITKEVKYLDVTDIVVRVQQLAEKAGLDMAEFESLVDDVRAAESHLESAIYGLDNLFVDLYRDLENQHSDLQYELEDIQNESFRR